MGNNVRRNAESWVCLFSGIWRLVYVGDVFGTSILGALQYSAMYILGGLCIIYHIPSIDRPTLNSLSFLSLPLLTHSSIQLTTTNLHTVISRFNSIRKNNIHRLRLVELYDKHQKLMIGP